MQFTNAFGEQVTGLQTSITENGDTIIIDTWENRQIVPGMKGSFKLQYKSWTSPVIDSETILQDDLLAILQSGHPDFFGCILEVFRKDCGHGVFFIVKFQILGDFPEIMITSDDMSNHGNDLAWRTNDAGVRVKKIPGSALTKEMSSPQVTLKSTSMNSSAIFLGPTFHQKYSSFLRQLRLFVYRQWNCNFP